MNFTFIQSKFINNTESNESMRKIIKAEDMKENNKNIDKASAVKSTTKFAYVTLVSGIDKSFKYRGFLYNAIIIKKALVKLDSIADFIVMIGYSENDDHSLYEKDIDLLREHGVIVYFLPRFLNESTRLAFAEMALLKIIPWSLTQYDRVQFLDGDVMPTKNMDCFFNLNLNTFTVGAASPLNSGWYLAIPDLKTYEYLKKKAIWRLNCDWDEKIGWAEALGPFGLTFRGGKKVVSKWSFNGADMVRSQYYLNLPYYIRLYFFGDAVIGPRPFHPLFSPQQWAIVASRHRSRFGSQIYERFKASS